MKNIKGNRLTDLLETRQWLCFESETENMTEAEYQR